MRERRDHTLRRVGDEADQPLGFVRVSAHQHAFDGERPEHREVVVDAELCVRTIHASGERTGRRIGVTTRLRRQRLDQRTDRRSQLTGVLDIEDLEVEVDRLVARGAHEHHEGTEHRQFDRVVEVVVRILLEEQLHLVPVAGDPVGEREVERRGPQQVAGSCLQRHVDRFTTRGSCRIEIAVLEERGHVQ